MKITFNAAKRAATLKERGLDFADATAVFAGRTFSAEDTRRDDGEIRINTVGELAGRLVIVCWTPRGESRRIVSMRKCNDRETALYRQRLDPR
ncbi:BrnT family toxin [Azorhizobium sp. AG788]|uniref:BrnT family toxin n=1 Tax=Azorhizobium sp. AG788 TaxID=2183897 RepID=UPI0031393DD4